MVRVAQPGLGAAKAVGEVDRVIAGRGDRAAQEERAWNSCTVRQAGGGCTAWGGMGSGEWGVQAAAFDRRWTGEAGGCWMLLRQRTLSAGWRRSGVMMPRLAMLICWAEAGEQALSKAKAHVQPGEEISACVRRMNWFSTTSWQRDAPARPSLTHRGFNLVCLGFQLADCLQEGLRHPRSLRLATLMRTL